MVLLIFGFSVVWGLVRFRAPVRSLRDQWRTARYVFRYDNALDLRGVGASERRSLTDELRRNIADAAAPEGVSGTLERLGHPRDLANAVAARDRRPTWSIGGAVAVGVWLVFQFSTFVGLDVLATSLEQMAPQAASVTVTTPVLPGIAYTVVTDASGEVVSMAIASNVLSWLIPTLCFLVFSSPWRLLTARAPRRASEI
jgi:hypothetical protein